MLGRGGMGEVYEAEQTGTGRRVALKVMNQALASEQDRKRFLREGRLAAGVSHPNVVYIYGSEEISGSPVIAMELVPSGTLYERVKRGPLPPTEAVDAALQLIAGLEAAEKTGVLHRDIKPANCFIGADGIVKIGDFGLSISTIARGESLLTAAGSVLGTPAYASPEQLRGEELTVAADIYSVGATLYHLLTGRLPYETTDFVKLITEVLDKIPPSPDSLRPEIPSGLAKVVLRCLAKDRTARFVDYGALRAALLPFSSVAPSPAVLGLRFVAGMIDEVASYLPSFLVLLWTGRDAIEKLAAERNLVPALFAVGFLLWDLFYFAIPEGQWGASLGKAVCGLRVVGPNRCQPGLARALVRALIFRTTWSVPLLATLILYTGPEYLARVNAAHWNPEDWFWFPLLAVLFCTMRRRNGFAGLHDLASGTRVIARYTADQRPRLEGFVSVAPPSPSGETSGPYEVLGSLGAVGAGELFLAHDPALRRNLWLHRLPPETEAVPVRRRDLSRATRLRWLNGHRDPNSAWDAYEASDGISLLHVPPQSWDVVRFWLHDLAAEYAAGSRHDSLAPALGLDRVWITADNRAVVLDFPCPGVARATLPPIRATEDAEGFVALQKFLNTVVRQAMGGPNGSGDGNTPPPLHAHSFLRSLAEARFETADVLVGNLRSLLGKTASVSGRRRLGVMALATSLALMVAISVAAMIYLSNKRINRTWPSEFPGSAELRAELLAYEAFRDHPALATAEPAKPDAARTNMDEEQILRDFRRTFRIHIAAHHRALVEDPNFWAHPVVTETLSHELRDVAMESLKSYSNVSQRRVEEADERLRALQPLIRAADTNIPEWAALGGFWGLLLLSAFLDLGCVLVLGEGLFLRLLGVVAVNRAGERASRLRMLGRTLISWSPCFLGAILSLWLWLVTLPGMQNGAPSLFRALALLGVFTAVAAGVAIWKPARGVADRMVGTWLVPR
jgi:uncharacterized RDD family membrane protein YckC